MKGAQASRILCLAAAVVSAACILPRVASAQSAPRTRHGTERAHFAPLETWKRAVLSGSLPTLQALYSHQPPSVTITGKTENHDPNAEPQFWLAAKENGLQQLKLQVKKDESTQSGARHLMFQIEGDMNAAASSPKIFAAIEQYWLDENGRWEIIATRRTGLHHLPQPVVLLLPQPKGDDPGTDPIYPNASEAKTEIAAALAVARRRHKRVLLDFGGNWCSDCRVLDATFHYPEVGRILNPSFVVVHVNIGQYDQNLDLADKYEIPLKKGVPSLAVLDGTGKLLVSQRQGDFENTSKIDLHDVEQFLDTWKP